MNKKHQGAKSELIASAWLISQGYEVFRNVSPFGPIDIIGIKNEVISFFDIKTYNPALRARHTITAEQQKHNVKIITVDKSGCCVIDMCPPLEGHTLAKPCKSCGIVFQRCRGRREGDIFCSSKCRRSWHREKHNLGVTADDRMPVEALKIHRVTELEKK